ncbi:MAG: hypothetical protein ABJC89_00915 [Acidobacteriota bacterium]
MAIHFRPLDFLQPFSLLRYRSLLSAAQWWPPERVRQFQMKRLQAVLRHAESRVPFYRAAWTRPGLRAADLRTPEDLARWPLLSKNQVRRHAPELTASNARRFWPSAVSSTGSTGPPTTVLLDRSTNLLEFAFYWRHWGWFGYRLGDRFAQLSWSEFSGPSASHPTRTQPGTGRLMLNARALSHERVAAFAGAMCRHRTRFLKGHPSALLHVALFIRSAGLDIPPLRAVFSTGEVLEPGMRTVIQEVFQAPVADAYGTMERVVAACECPAGRMHLNADYGCWELIDEPPDPGSGRRLARVVGTGLHNFSMPLVRYETGDLVEADGPPGPCPCGRSLPTIGRLLGRSVDAIVTPEGRVVTVAAIVFNIAPAIVQGQLVQEDLDRINVRVLPTPAFGADAERRLVEEVRSLVGPSMKIVVERVADPGAFGSPGTKHRAVVSSVYQRIIAAGTPLP